jgi:hypothetical protein
MSSLLINYFLICQLHAISDKKNVRFLKQKELYLFKLDIYIHLIRILIIQVKYTWILKKKIHQKLVKN